MQEGSERIGGKAVVISEKERAITQSEYVVAESLHGGADIISILAESHTRAEGFSRLRPGVIQLI